MRLYILNATLTFTSSIGIAPANLVHFCTRSKCRLEDISEKKILDFEICGESFSRSRGWIVGKEDSLLLGTITIIISSTLHVVVVVREDHCNVFIILYITISTTTTRYTTKGLNNDKRGGNPVRR